MSTSRQCADGLHGFCRADRASCDCPTCHLGPCEGCGRENLQKMYANGTLCATCYREATAQRGPHTPICDQCGKPGAFRNPRTRRNELLCTDCHKAAGESLSLVGSVSGLVAACAGAENDDPRHSWVHVKGTRFICQRCRTSRFDKDRRRRMREEMLRG